MQKEILEIVKAQASVRHMDAEEIMGMIQALDQGLNKPMDVLGECETTEEGPLVEPKNSRKEKYISCVICGERFKIITKKHLAKHGLTPKEYKEKFGIKGSLACKELARARKDKMVSMKLWERRVQK